MKNKKGYFITATNTERGKTIFTTGLTLWLHENSINAIPMKPIQSGMGKSIIAPDLEYIFKITNLNISESEMQLIQPYCYKDPCSPHLAAERNMLSYPSIDYIKQCVNTLQNKYQFVIAEGAGGLLVPIDRKKKLYIIDLIKSLDFDTILITQSGLGTINDTCLSIEALKNRGIKIAGFLFNDWGQSHHNDYIVNDNSKVIEEFTKTKYLGRIPYIENINKSNLLKIFNHLPNLHKLFKQEV